MILQTKELRDFQKKTSYIKNNSTIPALSYLKFESGMVTKNNLQTFCTMNIDCITDIVFLIDQQVLFALLSKTQSETIDVNVGKVVVLSDGEYKVDHPFEDPANYPDMPELPQSEPFEITGEIIDALSIAKSFVAIGDNGAQLQCVHMKDNYIAATDRFILYFEKFVNDLPNVILMPDEINLLMQLTDALLFTTDRRYFFKSGETTYSFTKNEFITPDFAFVITKTGVAGIDFLLDKKKLLNFCDLANSVTQSAVTTCLLTNEFVKVNQSNNNVFTPMQLGNDFEFTFNSRYIAPALKALPGNELKCKKITSGGHDALILTDDKFICSLMGFAPVN